MKQATQRPSDHPGRFAYEGLERVLHERARLGVVTSLAVHSQGLLFNDLKELCALTDGNLSRHLQVLEEEGIVEIWKGSARRRTQTLCRLSDSGRKRFLDYLSVLESVVADAAAVTRKASAARRKLTEGWSPA
jgi:DNA-binding MarR family transcriptional regulator